MDPLTSSTVGSSLPAAGGGTRCPRRYRRTGHGADTLLPRPSEALVPSSDRPQEPRRRPLTNSDNNQLSTERHHHLEALTSGRYGA